MTDSNGGCTANQSAATLCDAFKDQTTLEESQQLFELMLLKSEGWCRCYMVVRLSGRKEKLTTGPVGFWLLVLFPSTPSGSRAAALGLSWELCSQTGGMKDIIQPSPGKLLLPATETPGMWSTTSACLPDTHTHTHHTCLWQHVWLRSLSSICQTSTWQTFHSQSCSQRIREEGGWGAGG